MGFFIGLVLGAMAAFLVVAETPLPVEDFNKDLSAAREICEPSKITPPILDLKVVCKDGRNIKVSKNDS